ncbi:MAG: tyrosine-protein phosphatase [Dehalococcoidia bacterium]|nr:tyrosine-protein phosphatase [Dehalococcoidia bacterium]
MTEYFRASRHLDLDGAYNTRDIGGYETEDGRVTRPRTLFRSDSLHNLTTDSQRALVSEGLRTMVDLRVTDAVRDHPNVFAESSEVDYHWVNVMGDEPLVEVSDINVSSLGPDRPPDIYAAILDVRREWMGKVVKLLAAPGTLPALYHCNSGRDRAGLVTMLLLSIAGVPGETIVRDYSSSATYLWRRIPDRAAGKRLRLDPADFDASDEHRQAFETERNIAPPHAMRASIEHLQREYGGVRPYLTGAGVTEEELERLRAAIVE